jgi:hypothetical protein
MVNSAFVTDAEVDRCINQSWARMYDMLLAAGEDYYLQYVDVSTPVGGFYDLPNYTSSVGTAATDVYQIRGVDANYSGNITVNVPRFNWEERNLYLAAPALTPYYPIVAYRFMQNPTTGKDAIQVIPAVSTGVTNLRVWYYPNPKVLTGVETLDGRSGWEEWVVVDAAIKLLTKEESDTSQLEREAGRIWQQIALVAQNRDSGQSKRITDVSYNTGMWPYTSVRYRRW